VGSGTMSNPASRIAAAVVGPTVCALTPFARARKGPPQLGRCFLWRVPQEDGNAGRCLLGIEWGKAQVGHTCATDARHYRFRRDVHRRSNRHFNSRLTAGAGNILSILSRQHRENHTDV
jgi:hypothetical protein